jgi:hypothetical protein
LSTTLVRKKQKQAENWSPVSGDSIVRMPLFLVPRTKMKNQAQNILERKGYTYF